MAGLSHLEHGLIGSFNYLLHVDILEERKTETALHCTLSLQVLLTTSFLFVHILFEPFFFL